MSAGRALSVVWAVGSLGMHVNTEDRLGETRAKLTYAAAQADLRGCALSCLPRRRRLLLIVVMEYLWNSVMAPLMMPNVAATAEKTEPSVEATSKFNFFFLFFQSAIQT